MNDMFLIGFKIFSVMFSKLKCLRHKFFEIVVNTEIVLLIYTWVTATHFRNGNFALHTQTLKKPT